MALAEHENSAAAAVLALENERLRNELRARLGELRVCRARAVEAVEAARRRIERNLHDGTQQRLVSLALALGLLDAKLPMDPDAAKPIVREARNALAITLEELRELSQGLAPSTLIERGLGAALQELCHRSPVPSRLEILLDSRPPAEAEAAAYFVASEAITNAAKHARAGEARITVFSSRQRLVIEVADNGIGGAIAHKGSGLRGLTDRVEALGGRLTISSPPRRGTTVHAEIPIHEGTPEEHSLSAGVLIEGPT
jgi:signal transduction histidine kinase